ncbi:MAG: hypothetical protein HOP29_02175 [Phycisphaerales bacterium]|nr:hypothetical protein [Phycisphaerales bacterium]
MKVRKVEQFSEPKSQAGVATPAGWLFAMQYYLAKRASEAAFIEGYDMALSEPPYDDDQDSDYFDPVR